MKTTLRSHCHCAVQFSLLLVAGISQIAATPTAALDRSGAIRVQGPGVQPQLGFACCDQGISQMQTLFADPAVVGDLRILHAQVAVAITDFSPQRAAIVDRLNQAGIPVIAWMLMPAAEGYYFDADNASAAPARLSAFEKWTRDNHLRWAAVGLDIEPDFGELGALKGHKWRLIFRLLRRSLSGDRVARARETYSTLIRELQSSGYLVQTYQMPFMPAERSVRSTLLDRMLGTVDVRGNEEYVMIYTSFARPIGAGVIWSLGRNAQAITVGVTGGYATPGTGSGPLSWDEFSRDLIVAGHFTRKIGVYDLEGCVQQGFLSRLQTMDWSQSVLIPAQSVAKAERLGLVIRGVLWIASHFLWLICAALLLCWYLIWLWRRRRQNRGAR
jgi:hypothetical protein